MSHNAFMQRFNGKAKVASVMCSVFIGALVIKYGPRIVEDKTYRRQFIKASVIFITVLAAIIATYVAFAI